MYHGAFLLSLELGKEFLKQILLRTGADQDDQGKHRYAKTGYCIGFHFQTESSIQGKF